MNDMSGSDYNKRPGLWPSLARRTSCPRPLAWARLITGPLARGIQASQLTSKLQTLLLNERAKGLEVCLAQASGLGSGFDSVG